MADEIIEELWRIKDEIAREHGYDMGRMFEHLKSLEGRTAQDWLAEVEKRASDKAAQKSQEETPTPPRP